MHEQKKKEDSEEPKKNNRLTTPTPSRNAMLTKSSREAKTQEGKNKSTTGTIRDRWAEHSYNIYYRCISLSLCIIMLEKERRKLGEKQEKKERKNEPCSLTCATFWFWRQKTQPLNVVHRRPHAGAMHPEARPNHAPSLHLGARPPGALGSICPCLPAEHAVG